MQNLCFIILCLTFSMSALADDKAEKEMTVEEFLQNLSTVPDVVSRKDPFILAAAPFQSIKVEDNKISMNAPVLERYPVGSYHVVATLIGDKYPRALVRLPPEEKSTVVIVKEKDKLGNRKGIVSKISMDGVVVSQKERSPLGFVDKVDVLLKVGGNANLPAQPPTDAQQAFVHKPPAAKNKEPENVKAGDAAMPQVPAVPDLLNGGEK